MISLTKIQLTCLASAVSFMLAGCMNTVPRPNGLMDLLPPEKARTEESSVQATATESTVRAGASEGVADKAVSSPEVARRQRIFPGTDKVVNGAPRRAVGAVDDAVSLNFERVPLIDVVHAVLGDILKKSYSIEVDLPGEVTLRTASPVSRSDVPQILEATLAARGFAIVADSQGTLHVGNGDALKVIPSAPNQTVGRTISVVPLQHIGAREMADILKSMASPDSILKVDTVRNLLVLQGNQAQTQGWLDMVHTFDVDALAGMSVGIFALENADVKETSKIIEMLSARGDSPIEGVYRIIPIERLNSLLVIVPRRHLLDSVKIWIDRLDQSPESSLLSQLHVYAVQQGNAVQLARVLGAIYGSKTGQGSDSQRGALAPGLASATASSSNSVRTGGGATAASTAGVTGTSTGGANAASATGTSSSSKLNTTTAGATASGVAAQPPTVDLEGDVRIVADESTNTLLIYAPKRAYRRIEQALRQLDVAPAQVLIEATIIEISLTDKLQYGLQWYFSDTLGGRLSGKKGSGSLSRSSTSSALSQVLPGFNYTITDAAGSIRAVLNALASETGIKVVSSPSLLALDNQPAEIRVGNQQPILSGTTTTTGGNVTQSITYKDTGVLLRVIPRVNSGGLVTLDIAQEVTDVGAVDTATGQRTFLQRSLQSRIAIPSGQTAVLGGLIKDNTTNNKSGLPILSEIPIIGAAFGATEKTVDRTELLVVLTPRVLENGQQLKEISDEIRMRMSARQNMLVAK